MNKILKDTVAISGSTGFVGRNLIKFFKENNIHHVSIEREYFQRKNPPLISKCFCLVHLVGIGIETNEKDFQEINVEISKRAIDICKKSKIKKIIYLSGLGVSKKSTSDYFISKLKAEEIIKNSGLNYTIFRPSYIIGKRDYLTKNIKKQIRKKKILIPGSGDYILQPISINDVCKVVSVALESKNFENKIIDLVGPETISFKKFVKNSISQSNIVLENVPLKQLHDHALNDKTFPYGIEDLNILLGNFQGNHEKLERLSGFKFMKVKKI